MSQDANKILDNLSNEWARDLMNAKKRIAIMVEDNRLLKAEIDELKDMQKEDK